MRLLAIDTATEACSAALLMDGRIVSRHMEFERGHAEHILAMVDEVLAAAGAQLGDLDALAFGRGPGSFTGVRLAASVVQGLAFASGRSVVPVSDLAAVAQRALDLEPGAARVLVCNDARMQEVYWGCFERGPNGLAVLVGAEHVGPPPAIVLPSEWAGAPTGSVAGVGRGFRAHSNLLAAVGPSVRVVSDELLPRAEEIARLAAVEVEAGRLLPAEEAIPVYLRDDVARPQSRN
jgi:tRNA threonylcarbamoyladenosine biosynthesis protein TsaB